MKKAKNKIVYQDDKILKFLIESKKYGQFIVTIDTKNYDRIREYIWHVVFDKRENRFTEIASQKNGKIIKLHQLIMDNTWIDHIDLNIFNNCELNLRKCTSAENIRNQKNRITNTSGFKGVTWHKQQQKWNARITVNYKRIELGLFHDKDLAALAYNFAAIKHHGEFACLNQL